MRRLTLEALAEVLADRSPNTVPGRQEVVYSTALGTADRKRCGRDRLTITARIDTPRGRLVQVATVSDHLPDAKLPVALAACNACNQSEGSPASIVFWDQQHELFDLRFVDSIPLAAGLTGTVRSALTEFPRAAIHCLARLHGSFGL